MYVPFQGTEIEATVTAEGSVVHDWINQILTSYYKKQITVGLKCEGKTNIIPSRNNTIATLQLCVANDCIIIQMRRLDFIPQALDAFLSASNVTLVGAGVLNDVLKLQKDYDLRCSAKVFDIQALAIARWPGRYPKPGLKVLAEDILGLHMVKPMLVSLSDWGSKVLSREQIDYACIDAFASYKLGFKLLHSSSS